MSVDVTAYKSPVYQMNLNGSQAKKLEKSLKRVLQLKSNFVYINIAFEGLISARRILKYFFSGSLLC